MALSRGAVLASDDFFLERYKFVLDQKKALNKASLQVITFYQGAFASVCAGQFAVVALNSAGNLKMELARLASYSLAFILGIASLFALSLIASGMISWLHYRDEESEIESKYMEVSRRKPSIRDIFKWFETYISASIFAMFAIYIISLACIIEPMIK